MASHPTALSPSCCESLSFFPPLIKQQRRLSSSAKGAKMSLLQSWETEQAGRKQKTRPSLKPGQSLGVSTGRKVLVKHLRITSALHQKGFLRHPQFPRTKYLHYYEVLYRKWHVLVSRLSRPHRSDDVCHLSVKGHVKVQFSRLRNVTGRVSPTNITACISSFFVENPAWYTRMLQNNAKHIWNNQTVVLFTAVQKEKEMLEWLI